VIGRVGVGLSLIFVALASIAARAEAQTSRLQGQSQPSVDCQKCHGNREFLIGNTRPMAPWTTLYVPDSLLRDTKHRDQACTECHPGFDDGFPHLAPETSVGCTSCHEPEGADWAESIHAVDTDGDTPTCISCHTPHTVFGADDRRSPTHAMNVAELCGTCHADEHIIGTYFSGPDAAQARDAVAQYHTTVHGVALTRAGLLVSATCNDCHEAHKVLPADSAESSVNRANIAETCGNCHLGILDVYMQSAHGTAYETGLRTPEGHEAPVCVECHSSHEVVRADQPDWFLGISEKCGSCHEELLETYLGTYHGKVTKLGGGLTAKCSDCHTPHDMRPASDTASSVFPTNLVTTCSGCHPKANQNFVKYHAHASEHQRNRYPLMYWTWLGMTSLLVSVFSFFGLHTLLWLTRLAIEGTVAH
jgi:nitrate/TMAO reductase-like tetraheme cytochrome c subunit